MTITSPELRKTTRRPARPRVRYFAGLDVAQMHDYSALSLLERVHLHEADVTRETETEHRLVHLERWKVAYPDLLERLRELFARKLPGDLHPFGHYVSLAVDATGPGLPFYEDLRRAGLEVRDIQPVVITGGQARTKAGAFWHVPKPALVTPLQVAFQRREIKIPRGLAYLEDIKKELAGYEMKVSESRNITYSNNPREGGPEHDDLILASALALWNMRARPQRKLRLY